MVAADAAASGGTAAAAANGATKSTLRWAALAGRLVGRVVLLGVSLTGEGGGGVAVWV